MYARSGEGGECSGNRGPMLIIADWELYHLILKGRSIVSLWRLSGNWNTTTPLLVCYGDIYNDKKEVRKECVCGGGGGREKPSVLGVKREHRKRPGFCSD